MKKQMLKDGWHIVSGYQVYVENGLVVRGIKHDSNGSLVPAYPYKFSEKYNCYIIGTPTVSAFRKGWTLK